MLREKYSQPQPDGDWLVSPRVRREVTFRRHNLMSERFPGRKPFDVIFCRNVMIYFDQATRQQLINRFHERLRTGGYLFTGHSETLGFRDCPLRYIRPAVYRKEDLT